MSLPPLDWLSFRPSHRIAACSGLISPLDFFKIDLCLRFTFSLPSIKLKESFIISFLPLNLNLQNLIWKVSPCPKPKMPTVLQSRSEWNICFSVQNVPQFFSPFYTLKLNLDKLDEFCLVKKKKYTFCKNPHSLTHSLVIFPSL